MSDVDKKTFQKQLMKCKWVSLAYVCNDLMEFPKDEAHRLKLQSSLSTRDVTKRMLVDVLVDWRCERILQEQFIWPQFKPKHKPPPSIPWLSLHDVHANYTQNNDRHTISPQYRLELLTELTKQLNLHSSLSIGHIHRFLTQPTDEANAKLRTNLHRMPFISLVFVCVDIDRLPVGRYGKAELVQALIEWVRVIL
ncbi:hypothetical protein F5878DRAFT_592170 [Lentinula raphanica]|uniref:Uncharacterized protein n=1 Tax=Lentinula raphanica TaxID=153919 RepID=A0AA38U208_9AGAR|nr:hypothetical protein EV360DRAFT_58466 [Lentinula raphanica]KAJ3830937.1 hypothetical protein F5878DRAFT_592170 [Lentinula raphanica]